MGSVDNRIVNMQFNNREFEKNINTSINSLDNLKTSLDFKGAEKGFDEVTKSSSIFGNAVEEVKVKFSALEIIAITALTKITNAAIDMGANLVKSLSIDQISAGFTKYERETKAVQTMMNATGLSIEEVTEQLDKLMWYTDETSYSYSDMIDNIGKFTNAGIDLKEATKSMIRNS